VQIINFGEPFVLDLARAYVGLGEYDKAVELALMVYDKAVISKNSSYGQAATDFLQSIDRPLE